MITVDVITEIVREEINDAKWMREGCGVPSTSTRPSIDFQGLCGDSVSELPALLGMMG
jgi:hypothetical protein